MSTPTSSLNSSEIIPVANNSTTLLNVNMASVTKLNATNFLMWSRQVQALLDGYELSKFLDPEGHVPPETLTTDGSTNVNPAFTLWKRQDRLIYSSLIGAITNSIQPILAKADTSAEVWSTLKATYAKPSRGHIKQLKEQLKGWKKGTRTVDEFFQGLTTRFDQLALLGKAIDLEDQIEILVQGLPEEYKVISDQIEGRENPPTLTEIHEKLLNFEAKLIATAPSNLPITAHNANSRAPGGSFGGPSGRGRGNSGRGRGGFNWQPNNGPPSYNGPPSFNPRGSFHTPRPYQGKCQICSIQGHSARTCPQIATLLNRQQSPQGSILGTPYNTWQPRANYVSNNDGNWIVDSGATHHITSDLNNLALHQPYLGGEEVKLADGSGMPISQTGSTTFSTPNRNIMLKDILYVPHIKKNLISVFRLCNTNDVCVEFYPTYFQVKDLSTGAVLLRGNTKDELYEWPAGTTVITANTTHLSPKTDLVSWHNRLGHPSISILKAIISSFHLPLSTLSSKTFSCSDCLSNKSHKLPFHTNSLTSSHPLELLYSDVWTSPIFSQDNYKYYLVFVDHYTRYTWLYPLTHKSQVKDTFITFKTLVENRFSQKIKTLYSDNGGEFLALRPFLTSHGISHLTTPPHTPEHNGISERKHRHIVETGLTLLHHASVPTSFWPFAFAAAVYLINRLPSPYLDNESPYKKLFSQAPNYNRLRVFGCLCYPWLRPYTTHKLESRSKPCIFMGYSLTQSAYMCLDNTTGRMYISRHVVFVEDVFPFRHTNPSSLNSPTDPLPTQTSLPVITVVPSRTLGSSPLPPSLDPHHHNTTTSTTTHTSSSPGSSRLDSASSSSSSSSPLGSLQPDAVPAAQHAPSPPRNQHRMITRSKNNITKPLTKFSLQVTSSTPPIPQSVPQALKHPQWRAAMCDEINNLIKTGTYELVPPHPSQNVVGTRWIYTLKHHPDGSLERCKARFVAQGFHQIPGVDYGETFSPVVKSTTIRIVLNLAVSRNWSIQQLDVNHAFLQGKLNEEVFVAQPTGFIDQDKPHYVCKLHRALYGLKQAPRAWYLELKDHLLSLGFTNSLADSSLFTYIRGKDIVYLLVYVDDIIVTGSSDALIRHYIDGLASRFSLKNLGSLRYFLGIEVSRTSTGLHLCQRKYILDLLLKTKMTNAKPVATPMQVSPRLTLQGGTKLDNPLEYRQVLGSLQYLAFTRPDIAFAVNKLSQFMHSPTDLHWQGVKRVLRYLAGTPTHGLLLRADSPLILHAYSDADWAGDTDDFVSTNGYLIYLGSNPVSWSARKQKGVARSSTEAEYRSVANTASEIIWVQSLLRELGIHLPTQPVIYCDNVGATYLSANPVFHSRMKHLALDYHFIRQQVENKQLRVSHISTKDQLADALTKALPRPRFQMIMSKIGVAQLPPS